MSADDLLTGHGGRIDAMARAFPQAPLPWIDLSTGINPLAYPVPPISDEAWRRLPTGTAREACEAAMASAFGCDPAHCRAVAGTELVIRQLPAILGSARVALRERSYADHAESWAGYGARVLKVEDPLAAVGDVDAVVLVNPNNPDGHRWAPERIEAARRDLAARAGWLIVDEAYADLDPRLSMAPEAGRSGLIVLRSFGKFFGLAGVRLGAVLAPRKVSEALDRQLGMWDVSGPAQAIGTAAYADTVWQARMRRDLVSAAAGLSEMLSAAGLEDIGGTALFRFVRTPDAADLWHKLAERGISVRRFVGDDRHLRIGLPTTQGAARLAQALTL